MVHLFRHLVREYCRLGGPLGILNKVKMAYERYGMEGVWNGGILLINGAFLRRSYADWVRKYDELGAHEKAAYSAILERMENPPLISILMPVYNPRIDWLLEAVDSVQSQIYQNWELCIADDASENPKIKKVLEKIAEKNSRIRLCFRDSNGHISAATNSALAMASGEFVALLDQDDLLREHALICIAQAIQQNPDAGIIYSDEDKIEDGKRCDPYFKTEWDPYLMRCHNMVGHLGVYRTSLVRELGSLHKGFEGAQDWDLAFRCADHLEARRIVHISKVLYHWRIHRQSTAMADSGAKPYTLAAAECSIRGHLERHGVRGRPELIPEFSMFRIRYDLPDFLPLVSIIIATRDRKDLLGKCIESIESTTDYSNLEIIIIDNDSQESETLDYLGMLQREARARVIRVPGEFNFSRLNNIGVTQAKGEYLLLLNNDIEVEEREWLSEMIALAIQPGVGCVGARLWYPEGKLQHGGVILGLGGVAAHAHRGMPRGHYGYFNRACLTHTMSAVTGACLLVRKSIYEEVDGFDEKELTIGYNDVDFCLKVREKGYRNLFCAEANLIHHESASRGEDVSPEKRRRFKEEGEVLKKRWGNLLLHDPCYNPNLTHAAEDFGLAWPPR